MSEKPSSGGATNALPKLPIPSLEEMSQRYLARVLPLLSPEDGEKEQKILKDFIKNDGQKLHKRLLEHDKTSHSFVEEFWNDSYLAPNASVVLNLNPFFVLADDPTPDRNNQILRASSLVYSALKFCCTLRSGKLPCDMFRGIPLCMSQYKALFGAARIPDSVRDEIQIHEASQSTHIVVLRKGQMYYFDCVNSDHTLAITEADISRNLAAIMLDADQTPAHEAAAASVSVLTTEERREWARVRQGMSSGNQGILEIIDRALFVLCLDHNSPESSKERSANALHGSYSLRNGVQVGTCINRWYDKLQLIVCENGVAGVNFEHSAVDGHTVLRFVSDVFADTILRFAQRITKTMPSGGNYVNSLFEIETKKRPNLNPMKLEWELDGSLAEAIRLAEVRVSDKLLQCETEVLEYDVFGKDFIVSNQLSPDALVQMSIMFTHWRLYGRVVSQYEPVQTKAFHHGRTEAMRAVTPEAITFCRTFASPHASPEQKLESLRAALNAHTAICKEAAQGKGVERYLFALNCLANRQGEYPELFGSRGWKCLNHTILSSSNCGNPSLDFFGFGPVVEDGFGIGYIIKDDCLSYVVTSHHRQTKRFVVELVNFLDGVKSLLLAEEEVVVQKKSASQSIQTPHSTIPSSLDEGNTSQTDDNADGYSFWGDLEVFPAPKDSEQSTPRIGRAINLVRMSSSSVHADPRYHQDEPEVIDAGAPDTHKSKKSWKSKSGRHKGGDGYRFGDATRTSVRAIKKALSGTKN